MYLFFDTETNGLPKNWKAPVTNLKNWPRLVQIGWIFCDEKGNRNSVGDFIVKPNGFTIPKKAEKVHGISTEKAVLEGVSLEEVLYKFNYLIKQSTYLIAHNISFDEKIVGAELLRTGLESDFNNKKKLCTMLSSTNYCKIDGYYGYKWPKLSELHIKLFGKDFEGAHNAFADIDATEKCFLEMRKKGLI